MRARMTWWAWPLHFLFRTLRTENQEEKSTGQYNFCCSLETKSQLRKRWVELSSHFSQPRTLKLIISWHLMRRSLQSKKDFEGSDFFCPMNIPKRLQMGKSSWYSWHILMFLGVWLFFLINYDFIIFLVILIINL